MRTEVDRGHKESLHTLSDPQGGFKFIHFGARTLSSGGRERREREREGEEEKERGETEKESEKEGKMRRENVRGRGNERERVREKETETEKERMGERVDVEKERVRKIDSKRERERKEGREERERARLDCLYSSSSPPSPSGTCFSPFPVLFSQINFRGQIDFSCLAASILFYFGPIPTYIRLK